MSAKRVLMICPNGEFGGAERSALNFAVALNRRGNWECSVALLRPGQLESELEAANLSHHVLAPFRFSRPQSWWPTLEKLREITASEHISLLHSEMAYGQIVGALTALRTGIPNIWYQHGPIDAHSWQQRLAAALPSKGYLTNSAYTRGMQPHLFSGNEEAIIAPPLAPDFLTRPRNPELREALGIAAHEKVALLPARFQPKFKGQGLALAAFAPLAQEIPFSRLLLVGAPTRESDRDYPDFLELRREAESLNARVGRPAVLLLPFDRDIIPYLDAADFLVSSSLIPEPFGCTLVEALARGLSIVAARAGGALDIAGDCPAAELYDCGNVESLRQSLRRAFARSNDENKRIASFARKRAETFTADHAAAQLEAFYDQVVGAR